MRKGDKGKTVFGVFVILAIIVAVFGSVVSAEDLSVGLKQSVDDAEIQTAVGNLSSVDQNASIGCLANTRLVVPFFSQRDPEWKDDLMGSSGSTIGLIGCAMTCTAMVLKYYNVETDPGELNTWLSSHDGYTSSGAIYWSKPAEYSSGKVTWIDNYGTWTWSFSTPTTEHWNKLNEELEQGYPVILKVSVTGGSHYIIVTGREGSNYYINDPWDWPPPSSAKTLASYGNTFKGMRFYHGIPSVLPPPPTNP